MHTTTRPNCGLYCASAQQHDARASFERDRLLGSWFALPFGHGSILFGQLVAIDARKNRAGFTGMADGETFEVEYGLFCDCLAAGSLVEI